MKLKGPLYLVDDKIYKLISNPKKTRKGLWVYCKVYYIKDNRVKYSSIAHIPASSLVEMKKLSQLKIQEIV